MPAKSASERKRDFDRVMRNRRRSERADQPERSPVVLYLSDEARSAISTNRKFNRAVGEGPQTDSAFVERAILLVADPTAQVAADAAPDQVRNLRETVVTLNARLDAARERVDQFEEQGALVDRFADVHREEFGLRFWTLHAALREAILTVGEGSAGVLAAHRLITDYLLDLRESVVRDG